MRVKYLKMISYLAFIFLTANFMLSMNYTNCISGYVFLWMLFISVIMCSDLSYNLFMTALTDIFIFVPVLYAHGIVCRAAIIITGAFIIGLQKRIKAEINYDQVLYQVNIMFPTAIAFMLIAFMATDSDKVNEFIVPYAILYLVFSIILLRTMRNYKYNVVNKKIRKINTVYLIIIMAFSAGISLKQVRNLVSAAAACVYKGIAYVIYNLACFISFFLFKIFNKLHISEKTQEKFFSLYRLVFGGPVEKQEAPPEPKNQSFWAQHGVSLIVNIIIVAVIIYLVYKLMKMQYSKKKETVDFVEKREAIKNNKNKEGQRNDLYGKLKKGSYKDKIRYYYYRFLRDCSKKNIEIACSDTTREINNKAEERFNKNCLNNMRDIYLKAKYTENECTAEDFDGFHKNYKEK